MNILPAPRPSHVIRRLGPGLITGAADDDPRGIATYSQVGAQFGYSFAWTMLFSLPFMIVIQEISDRTRHRRQPEGHYPAGLVRAIISLLLVANVIDLGTDLRTVGAGLRLLLGGSVRLYTVMFGVLCVTVEISISYARDAGFLNWLTLSLFSYVVVLFTAHVLWSRALLATVAPHLRFNGDDARASVAVLGTTIGPYLFFWQAALEVENRSRRSASALPHPA